MHSSLTSQAPQPIHERVRRTTVLIIFLVAATAYLALRSRHWIGDGVRYVPVAFSDEPRFGQANHFLSPLWAWATRHALEALGMLSSTPESAHVDLIGAMQAWNALFAAVALAALFALLASLGVRQTIAASAVLVVGLGHCFALHATDMTEPMPSVALMFLSLLIAHSAGRTWSGAVGAGALLGIACAFYLVAGGAMLLGSALVIEAQRARTARAAVRAALPYGAGALGAFLAIALVGNIVVLDRGWLDSARSALTIPTASGLFGVFRFRHLAGAAFGHASAWAPLVEYRGASQLLTQPTPAIFYNLLAFALAWAGLALVALRARRVPFSLPLIAAETWFVATFVLAAYWSATYDKLWLFGILGLAIATSMVLEHDARTRRRDWKREPLTWIAASLALLSIAVGVVPRRFSVSTDTELARQIVARIGPKDVLVAPGWDGPSAIASTVFNFSLDRFSLVDEAVRTSRDATATLAALTRRTAEAHERGGNVCFLELLSLSEEEWSAFFGQRLALPYGILDSWRGGALPPERLVAGDRGVDLACIRPPGR